MLSAAKTSEFDTPSVFSRKTDHVFDNSDVFAALNMTKIHYNMTIKFNSENSWVGNGCIRKAIYL
jgi:hypothetical protein